jgi:hypothetical protein
MSRISLSVAFVLALLGASAVHAATFVVPTDENMVERSHAVVVSEVAGSTTALTADGSVETITSLHVSEVIKGAGISGGSTIAIHEPGGRHGDRSTMVPGSPRFSQGEQVLLFLRQYRGQWAVTDLVLGSFHFAADVAGQSLLVREEEEIGGWDLNGKAHVEPHRAAEAFLHYLREVSAGRPVQPNYQTARLGLTTTAVGAPPAADIAPSTPVAGNAAPSTYTLDCGGGVGCRWAVFPNVVSWYNQNTEPGAPNGGIDAIRSALAAWTNDCGSNVNYAYVGGNAGATGGLDRPDGTNAVMFEVSLASRGVPPYSCASGGTIALGGITTTSGSHTHPVTGETFYSTAEGDVVGNVGLANCTSFLSTGNFVTALVHEVGHTLGFRHSNQDRAGSGACPSTYDCSSTAVMNSIIVNGLNGALQAWDTSAVRSVYPGGSCTVAATHVYADFNGDGRSDIVLRNGTTGQNAIWLMNGFTLQQGSLIQSEPNAAWKVVGIGDFDGDGRADLLWRNSATGEDAIWLMNGFTLKQGGYIPSQPLAWKVAGVGDFNGDGRSDILLRNTQTGENAIWLMNGLTLQQGSSIRSETLAWDIAGVGDFNGDGKADIVLRNGTNGQNAMWLMNGFTLTSGSLITAEPTAAWKIAGVGDFNGDGRADLLWRNSSSGQNSIWLMNGFTLQQGGYIPSETLAWQIAEVGDFNADGRADIVLRNNSTGQNAMWLMNGTSLMSSSYITGETPAWNIAP